MNKNKTKKFKPTKTKRLVKLTREDKADDSTYDCFLLYHVYDNEDEEMKNGNTKNRKP
jgi:hypothetical protein